MRPAFPGMDPWLEHPDLWPDVHNSLIVAIRDVLSPLLVPRYAVRVESRTTVLSGLEVDRVYEPDVAVRAGSGHPLALTTDTYVFPWTTPIPAIPIPLLPEDAEPVMDLNSILHGLMDRARYDIDIDYSRPPRPWLRRADAAWAAPILAQAATETTEPHAKGETTP
jgi:hypothetical protein